MKPENGRTCVFFIAMQYDILAGLPLLMTFKFRQPSLKTKQSALNLEH